MAHESIVRLRKKSIVNRFRTVPMNELYSDDFYDRQCVARTESCKKGSLGPHAMCEIFDTSHHADLVKRISTSLPHSVVSFDQMPHVCALTDNRKKKRDFVTNFHALAIVHCQCSYICHLLHLYFRLKMNLDFFPSCYCLFVHVHSQPFTMCVAPTHSQIIQIKFRDKQK